MKAWIRIPLQFLTLGLIGLVVLTALITGGYFYVEPSLPKAEELSNVRFQIPSSYYSRDGRLMSQYGEQKRTPLDYEDVPPVVINAFLAAEDDRFFEHSGIDYAGIIRGALFFVSNPGERVPGGSTITQQVVRTANLMSRDYSLVRKFKEAILAFRVENEFTKEEILGLFLNTTFFGQRSNGIVAAASTYFNKEVDELTLSEVAIIAGIPQGPSIMNPYNGPENAARRRTYVLRRMFELGYINAAERAAAEAEPIVSQRFGVELELSADYVASMAIAWAQAEFGEEVVQTAGLKITTTIDSRLQRAANQALRDALEAYDRDHGYRGRIGRADLDALFDGADAKDDAGSSVTTALYEFLSDYPDQFDSEAAVVVAVNEVFADVYLRSAGLVTLGLDSFGWARRFLDDNRQGPAPRLVSDVLNAGDVIRLRRLEDGSLELFQVPVVQGALVSVDPFDGAVVSLVGGYSHQLNSYNRVTQAERQPGSAFKPFFYLSALANGYTLSSIVLDAPLRYFDETLEESRSVTNYDGRAHGEVPVRYALSNSLNMSADRIVRDILPRNAIPILERFGFDRQSLPNNASLALGSGVVTPLELANAYSILANGGYAAGIRDPDSKRVAPYFIQRVEDAEGNVLYDASLSVATVCPEAPAPIRAVASTPDISLIERRSDLYPPLRCAERVEQPQLIYLITDVLKQVIKSGSGARTQREPALQRRSDLAGKTGTTTGPRDAWFAGFNSDIVAVVRVGFDVDTRELGRGEQGGVTAIPAWIDFMREALDGMPEKSLARPPGIVDRRINPATGLLAADCNRDARFEMFVIDNVPEQESDTACRAGGIEPTDPRRGSNPGNIFQ